MGECAGAAPDMINSLVGCSAASCSSRARTARTNLLFRTNRFIGETEAEDLGGTGHLNTIWVL